MPRRFITDHPLCRLGRVLIAAALLAVVPAARPADPGEIPPIGHRELRILDPRMLELFLVNTQGPATNARPVPWDWIDEASGLPRASFPKPEQIDVRVDGKTVAVHAVGFRRMPLYAPLPSKPLGQTRDLRIANSLFVELVTPIPEGARVEATGPEIGPGPGTPGFAGIAAPDRASPAIHVSHTGYEPDWPKRAQVGYTCGTLGELRVDADRFEIVARSDGRVVHAGTLRPRRDTGFKTVPQPYQRLLEADFTAFAEPGEYRLRVPGLGVSLPFRVGPGVSGALARALALGLFHQRDGANRQELPWTRFVDGPAHLSPAAIPNDAPEFAKTWARIAGMSTPPTNQAAPHLRDPASQLYPSVRSGTVDVSGGHRDAGDYSKYTCNTAGTLAVLMAAVDDLPGVRDLDNLGIPESGDGIGDVLQEAKWEADFLAKMQDDDGGFWFLVYPKNRAYEDNVLPSGGDLQVVFPKNTSATAAAVGALAQAGSSPAMVAAYPAAAAEYRRKAAAGWEFLERAIARHGRTNSYQKVTHYGDVFRHDDELAFAAAGMFAMTGNRSFENRLKELCPDPTSPTLRRWGWWNLFEAYGHAFRAYAFAVPSGRLKPDRVDAAYLAKARAEVLAAGDAALMSSAECAYGASYDIAFKRALNAGYHFSASIAFDLAVAAALSDDPARRGAYRDAAVANVGYTAGSNPANVCFVTGLGWQRVRNVVSQFAQNDRRVLPPTGLPGGEISGFPYNFAPYRSADGKNLLARLYYPGGRDGVPIYDRFCDSFDVGNEATIIEQARSAATALWLFAGTPLRTQKWQAPAARIVLKAAAIRARQPLTATLVVPGLDLGDARITWESPGHEPATTAAWTFAPGKPGASWIEAEADFPDGRRVFARTEFDVPAGR